MNSECRYVKADDLDTSFRQPVLNHFWQLPNHSAYVESSSGAIAQTDANSSSHRLWLLGLLREDQTHYARVNFSADLIYSETVINDARSLQQHHQAQIIGRSEGFKVIDQDFIHGEDNLEWHQLKTDGFEAIGYHRRFQGFLSARFALVLLDAHHYLVLSHYRLGSIVDDDATFSQHVDNMLNRIQCFDEQLQPTQYSLSGIEQFDMRAQDSEIEPDSAIYMTYMAGSGSEKPVLTMLATGAIVGLIAVIIGVMYASLMHIFVAFLIIQGFEKLTAEKLVRKLNKRFRFPYKPLQMLRGFCVGFSIITGLGVFGLWIVSLF
ncbi:hypothetical protein [Agaribacterium sp. ZY112]|uniref:hypothetical protein n=1 Tax=Agaribacterium sp. ZY112 TaxID=3233574 RepID=UPI003524F42B